MATDIQILIKALAIHEHDPNFPIAAIIKAKEFLTNPDVIENPQLHSKLIHEMYIEAALMDNHSPYAEVRSVVSNKDDPTLPVRMGTSSRFMVQPADQS
jgi:hypothetical protein